MALSGVQIQKLLPKGEKANCKECGSNTCLAFAMKLAAKKAELSECPYASDEAKQVLGAASEPPVKVVMLGVADPNAVTPGPDDVAVRPAQVRLGEETVLYRHEKTFVNQTAIGVNIDDNLADMEAVLEKIKNYTLERVGQTLWVDTLCCTQKSGNDDQYAATCKKIYDLTGIPMIIRGANDEATVKAAKALQGTGGMIAGVTAENAELMRKTAEECGHSLCVTGKDVDSIGALTQKLKDGGFNNLVIDFGTRSLVQSFQLNSIARKAALKSSHKPMGYTFVKFIDENASLVDSTVEAVNQIDKYGGIVILPSFNPAQMATLMTLRLNIFTDPQKPIQMEPKVYPIGEPDRNSPVFVTTNFSLTYFIVAGEIENSGISAWLVLPECEGFSVLTAWSAGKFSGAIIGKFIKEYGLEDMVDTRSIVIPGYVSQISGELEENLPGWKVMVGPQEASDLESFIKSVLKM